ncbi:biotin/lipoyl-containing protein [Halanaerobium salsuginis]|jgi:biotin carboxyl carrier protein|uniref:Biotin-requiring enzyme n=1 Tax=Halanaerobium salsuginis TaxID=29563 RepID=A0A1I4KZ93_9FIRM|nr:biotin/lipoyl-containing protein [Halanaerobium salsuginis]SFL84075.1 Biotin-requiring enzyme [Halanaerobium salsuginis]
MAKNYRVEISGEEFIVKIEEIKQNNNEATKIAPVQTIESGQNRVINKKKQTFTSGKSVDKSGSSIVAPMPGSILEIKANVGDKVAAGEALIILEAMKMENEVTADQGGIIKAVKVAVGDSVEADDLLIELE